MKFKEKVILVTGGNSGIGKSIVFKFLEEGAFVVIGDLSENLQPEILNHPQIANVFYIQTDVSNFSSVQNLISGSLDKYQRIDVVVNNAGITGPRIKTADYPIEEFEKVMQVNVMGVFYGMKAVLPYFSEIRKGIIINIASIAGQLAMPGFISYCASKHAVLGMTKTAAVEYARVGIRINAVCPGFTETPMFENADVDEQYRNALQQVIPLKRFGKPEEIANAALYLASDDSSFMIGQGLILDGGLILQ
jgi:NAD(P)-dependent dehydrogenase (short-subunit alcohol dehydrogenase family)